MKNEHFCVPEREELPQEEKYDEKTRGPELQKMPEEGEESEKVRESDRTTARKQETDRGQQIICRGKYFFQRQGHGQFITFEVKGRTIRKLMGGAGEVQKKYSRKGILNEKKIHARQLILKNIFMLWPEKNSYKEFDDEKKFPRLENSPPPPHNVSNGPSLKSTL